LGGEFSLKRKIFVFFILPFCLLFLFFVLFSGFEGLKEKRAKRRIFVFGVWWLVICVGGVC